MMRQYFILLLVLSVLVTAGCVEEYTPGTNVTTAPPAPVPSTVVTHTPAGTPTPVPEEMAYLSNIQCAVIDESVKTYHCNGNVRVRSGESREVQVIARYPDNNTFYSGTEDLGGENPVSKPFAIFPDPRYNGQSPSYFVKIDHALYPVTGGTAWSNTPGAEGIDIS
jgi:hypothetical protein